MDALIDKLFFPLRNRENFLFEKMYGSQSLKSNSSLLQSIPSEYQQKLLDNNWLSSDLYISNFAKGSQLNLEPFFRTFNNNFFRRVPKLSPCVMHDYFRIFSSPCRMSGNTVPEFNFLWETVMHQTPKISCNLNSKISKVSVSDHLVIPIATTLQANNKTNLSLPVSKDTLPSLCSAKKQTKDLGNLNQQMASRKARELNKRSKKRRRRQKKSSKVDNNHKLKMNCEVTLPTGSYNNNSTKNKRDNCDILCDFTISDNSSSVQIVLPNVSSFVVTFESASDDDSDWDTSSEVDCFTDDSEFQITSLYVARFSTNSSSNLSISEKSIPYEIELDLTQSRLKEVNRIWDESTKHWEKKAKSSTMVSFVPDDELVEILPVEMCDRKGEWEIYACERLRFRRRINELEKIISPCLNSDHRKKVFYKLYQSVL